VASCSFIRSVLSFATFSPSNRYWSFNSIMETKNKNNNSATINI
jgi:hypothetical protein